MAFVYEEPPCSIDDILQLNFSFGNLQKYLGSLVNNNKEFFLKISDIFLRLEEIDKIKQDLKDVSYRTTSCEERLNETDQALNIHNQRISDEEARLAMTSSKVTALESENRTITSRLFSNDDQILSLHKYCEENNKSIIKLAEINEKIRNSNETLNEKLDKVDKLILKINNELLRFNELDKNIKDNFYLIEEEKKNNNDFQYLVNKKFSELDSNILNLIQSVSEINKKGDKAASSHLAVLNQNLENSVDTTNNGVKGQISYDQFSKLLKEMENIKKLNRDFNEKLEKLNRNVSHNENFMNDVTAKLEQVNLNKGLLEENIENVLREADKNKSAFEHMGKKLFETESKLVEADNTITNLTEQLVKVHETIKNISNIASGKAGKDDLEKITKQFHLELEKLLNKVNEQNKSFETKIKNNITANLNQTNLMNSNSKQKPDKESFESEEELLKHIKDLLNKELPEKLNECLTLDNALLKNLQQKIDQNAGNIDELGKETEIIKNKITEEYLASLFQRNTLEFSERINELHSIIKKYNKEIEQRFKDIEGEGIMIEEDLYDYNHEGMNTGSIFNISLKEILKLSLMNFKKANERVEKISQRQDNMNSEILNKVKKDLSHESSKILDDFKIDLRHSIGKIEEQLREKVDKFSLDEFSRRFDWKLNNEFNKKIDRSDLKKNNNLINKKIDTLENKISKTLVDTLIDLQLDEMPLIIKKSLNGEKCASCNQFVQEKAVIGGMPINAALSAPYQGSKGNNAEDENSKNYYATQNKFKLRNIQDNSNKYGTGSYSRFLGNVENVNEELYSKNKNGLIKPLPEIPTTKTFYKKSAPFYNPNNSTVSLNTTTGFNLNNNIINLNASQTKDLSGINNNNNPSSQKIKIDVLAEKQFSFLINEELEKKIINPENLIKTANKVYENVEKRNASNLIK